MREVELEIPPQAAEFLRQTIRRARGNEVYFLARVLWDDGGLVATLDEVEVFARGASASVPAIVEGAEDWDLAIHNHPSGSLDPSAADLAVASELGNRGVGFAIIDSEARRHYLVVKPFRSPAIRPVDLDRVRWLLGPEGPLARELGSFQSREGQIEMAVEVARALNEKRVIASEAGTGVGKSFAYLIPAILWAVENRKRVVVSTGTIHLQEQLVRKDLPFLEKVLPVKFAYALIKGRGNYACRRKIEELPQQFEMVPENAGDQAMLEDIVAWSSTTEGGSLADLAWSPPRRVWERVMSETDKSLKVNCNHYAECFFYRAKRQASRSHVVVANHHLFFADLGVRRSTGNYQADLILPAYSRVIFDEAHHIEDVASEHLGVRFTRAGIRNRLGRMRSKDGQRGALAVLVWRLIGQGDPVAAEAIAEGYSAPFSETARAIDGLFEDIEELLEAERRDGLFAERNAGGALKLRYRGDPREEAFWSRVEELLLEARAELDKIARMNARASEVLERARIPDDLRRTLMLEIESFANRLAELEAGIERFTDFEDATQVRWIAAGELDDGDERGSIGFACAPVSVADVLLGSLFERLESVIMTSATLSVAGRPDFLAERLGFSSVAPERFGFMQHASPFRFREQVLLVVPTDLPDPTQPAFEARLPDLLFELLEASRGRAFVLFTSYSLLRRMHERLGERLAAAGLRPLAQGEAPRSDLLKRFVETGDGVLFGTDSFWEGVDVPGRALEHVIITRLPFRVPSEPLQEARLEDLASRGKNAFTHFTVPQAVLRFKQGFGRLIRTESDRGVVTVLDRRMLTRPYGKVFLQSLPQTLWFAGGARAAVERVAGFLAADAAREAHGT